MKLLYSVLMFIGFSLSAEDKRPNIMFIFTDDHAYQAIGAYGGILKPHVKTPNIDSLAKDGMMFQRCYTTNSICGPMRAVIQTGKYSHINGFLVNGNKFDGTQQTFPKLLKKSGYPTAVIGKWHLGTHMAPQGYDYSEVLMGQGPYYNPPMRRDADGDGKAEETIKHTGYTTDIITDLTLDWLKNKRDKSKPFMVMYQHKAPHRDWQPGPKHLTLYDDVTLPEPDTLFDNYEGRGRAAHQQDMTIAETMKRKKGKVVKKYLTRSFFGMELKPLRNLGSVYDSSSSALESKISCSFLISIYSSMF